jgi:hypothetical protein
MAAGQRARSDEAPPTGPTSLVVALSGAAGSDEIHAALANGLQAWIEMTPHPSACTGYVLSQRIADPDIDGFSDNRGWAPAPQALLQLHFAGEATARRALALGSGLLPPAARALIDVSRSSLFIAQETAVFAALTDADRWTAPRGPDAPVKMVVQNWKRPDLTFEQYSAHWRNVHGRLVREHGPDMGFRRYVQSHRVDGVNDADLPAGWGRSPDGGMTEVWWTSHAEMKRALATAAAQAASARFADDEQNFVHPPRMSAMLARETRVVFPGDAAIRS